MKQRMQSSGGGGNGAEKALERSVAWWRSSPPIWASVQTVAAQGHPERGPVATLAVGDAQVAWHGGGRGHHHGEQTAAAAK